MKGKRGGIVDVVAQEKMAMPMPHDRHYRRSIWPTRAREDVTPWRSCARMLLALTLAPASCMSQ